MTTIDRYILRLFLKVLVTSFLSLTGLFIVIDAFSNLEEFVGYSRQMGLEVLLDYYRPRVFLFFDRTSGLLALVAAIFAVTLLQRHNELTALMAGGISKWRVVRPLLFAAATVSLLAVINREVCIPAVRESLSRNAQNWLGDKPQPLHPRRDYRTDILLGGRQTVAAEQQIVEPHFRLHGTIGSFSRHIVAENAYYRPARRTSPAGYLLTGVRQPANASQIPSATLDGEPVILSPLDTPWLEEGQLFVVSGLTFEQLTAGNELRQYSSSPELIRGLHQQSLDYGADVRVTIHARFVQPFLDMTLLFLGLPVVLARESRNLFVAAGICLLVVAGFFFVVLSCHLLGNNGYLLSPVQAAWLPLIIFAPLARAACHPMLE